MLTNFQFISQIHDAVLTNTLLSNNKKAIILEAIAECDYCLGDGANEFIQMFNLGCKIMNELK